MSVMACSKGNEGKTQDAAEMKKKSFHGDMKTKGTPTSGSGMLMSLKANHLAESKTKTIGEAFDSYKHAKVKEWKETPSTNGSPYFIDYICWFPAKPVSVAALKDEAKLRGLEIKFAIREDGETYITMARRLDVKGDGTINATPLLQAEINKTVTAIYENREISF